MPIDKIIYFLLIFASVGIYPSWAEDSLALKTQPLSVGSNSATASSINLDAGKNQPDGNSIAAAPTNNSAPEKRGKKPRATLPQKVFSVAAALLIGTPVCVVRRSKYEEWYGINGMVGDSAGKGKKVLAGIFWFPFAVMYGTCEAPFDAVANALMYPAFSQDQLSQGKLIQNN